jgi:hypothetical protein
MKIRNELHLRDWDGNIHLTLKIGFKTQLLMTHLRTYEVRSLTTYFVMNLLKEGQS